MHIDDFAEKRQDQARSRNMRASHRRSKLRDHPMVMPRDRRLSIRKVPQHLGYLSLPFNNGGFVLDISEGGLGFQAIAPLKATGPIHFRFAIDSPERITAAGEVAWIDETGKAGGLSFTQLPEGIREQIRAWTGQPKAEAVEVPVAEPPPQVAESAIPVEVSPSGSHVAPPPAVPAVADNATEAETSSYRETVEPTPGLAVGASNPLQHNLRPLNYSGPANQLSMFSLAQEPEIPANDLPAPPSPGVRHPVAAVGLTIALAFMVSIAIFAYVCRTRAGDALFAWGQKLWSGNSSQPIPQNPAPLASPAPDPAIPPQQ